MGCSASVPLVAPGAAPLKADVGDGGSDDSTDKGKPDMRAGGSSAFSRTSDQLAVGSATTAGRSAPPSPAHETQVQAFHSVTGKKALAAAGGRPEEQGPGSRSLAFAPRAAFATSPSKGPGLLSAAAAKSRRNSLECLTHPSLPGGSQRQPASLLDPHSPPLSIRAGVTGAPSSPGSDASTCCSPYAPSPSLRASGGGNLNKQGILKRADRAHAANRTVGPAGSRSIVFKNVLAPTTFLFNKDPGEHDDDDSNSDGSEGFSRSNSNIESLQHRTLRVESVSGLGPDPSHEELGLQSCPSVMSLNSGNASKLFAVKKGLAPSSKFPLRSDSGVSAVSSPDLPPVKSSGHRSIGQRSYGSRSIASDISLAGGLSAAARNCKTPSFQVGRISAGSDVSTSSAGAPDDAALSPAGKPARRAGSRLRQGGAAGGEGEADGDVPSPGSLRKGGPRGGSKVSLVAAGKSRRGSQFLSAAHCAISIRFLRVLLVEYVVPLAQKLNMPLGQITTSMVNEMIVKQLTAEEQCRLVDMPGIIPKEDVGAPDYFISHAWCNPFSFMVQCVCDHLSGALDSTKVWIDIVAVNQHPTEQQQDDLANLRTAIHMSKATLVCLDVAGAALKRVWCLYEADNTITLHGPDRLTLITPNFSTKDMASVFRSISVEDAGAYKQSDKDKIIEDIVAHHGSTTAFNTQLKLLFLLEPLDQHADLAALLEGTGGRQEYDFSPLQQWLASPRAPQVCVISGPAGSGKSTVSAALCWDEKEQRRREAMAKGKDANAAKAEADAPGPSHEGDGGWGVGGGGGGGGGDGGGDGEGVLAGRPLAARGLKRQVTLTGQGGREIVKPLVHAYHFCRYSDVRRQSPMRIVKTLAYQLAQKLPLLRNYYAGLDLGQVQALHQASAAFRLLLLKPLQTLLPRDEQVVILIDALDEADAPGNLPLDNPVLQLMLHQLSCLPRNVRVITSTRSAPHLMGPLRRKFNGALELSPTMVRRRETTLAQLERRLMGRFGATAAAAVMGCGGGEKNLVYYSAVMVLEAPLDVAPETLPVCYSAVFGAQWPKLMPAQRREAVRLMQVLMAAREPLYLSLLAGLGLEQALALLPGWQVLFYEREYKVYTLHKSLHDWLKDEQASGEFYADPRVGHATLARFLFNAARPLSAYGTKYLATHLLEAMASSEGGGGGSAGPGSAASRQIMGEMLDQTVTDMEHLEAVSRAGHVFKLHAELATSEPKSRAVHDVVRWLGLNSHVLWAHPAAVTQLANEAPPSSALAQALKRPRRTSTITTDLQAAAAGAITGSAAQTGPAAPPVQLLNKLRHWPAQLSILAQHHKGVNSCSFNPAGTLLASGSEDRSVRLWDPLTGEQKAVLFGHTSQVLGVAFSASGQLLASASCDSTVRLWDAATGEEKGELAGHVDWVRDVAFAPAGSGRLLASCGDDKTVRMWELSGPSPSLRSTMLGHTDTVCSIGFSPDGALLASGSNDRSIRLWDVATGKQAGQALVAHKFGVTCVAFSPDGTTLASGSEDKMVFLWALPECRSSGQPAAELAGHMDKVLSVSWNAAGTMLASASADGSVRLWDAAARKVRGVLLGHASIVVAVAFSPTRNLLASAASDNTVRLWDPLVGCEDSVEEAANSHMDSITSVAFSPSGQTVASAGQDWTVRLWDPSDGNHMLLLQGHTDIVRCVAFSPTGHLLASASSDRTVRLWDPAGGAPKALLEGHSDRVLSVAFSGNGRLLVAGCHDGTMVLWDVQSREQRGILRGHAAPITAVTFSPNSKQVASGSSDQTVRLWHAQLCEQQVLIKGTKGGVTGVAFNQQGNLLASASYEERSVRVWDPASGTLLACIASAALCTGGQFAMYSLVRHAPCVRAIALQRRTSGGGGQPRASGGGGGGPDSAVTSPSNVFMRTPSFTPNTPQLLQPSMTMYRERRGSTSGGAAASDFFAPSSSISGGYPSAYGASGPGSGAGQPPVLQTMMSMRSSFTTMEELPKLMELVTDSTCPMLAVYTPFVSPRSVALFKERIVMSDGPHIYFYEAGDPGVAAGWRSNRRYSAAC